MKRGTVLAAVIALVVAVLAGPAGAASQRNFRAHMNGDGAGVETLAQGQAIFQFSKDGSALGYKLIVANLDDLLMAHIHVAAEPGGNGPPVVWLYPDAPPPALIPGTTNGVVATGTAMEGDSGVSITFDALRDAIAEGRAYVNVHTAAYPGGEIRGEIH